MLVTCLALDFFETEHINFSIILSGLFNQRNIVIKYSENYYSQLLVHKQYTSSLF